MKLIDEIIREVFIEASKGVVKIECLDNDYWRFYTRFYIKYEGKSNVKNDKYPVVEIPNYKVFLKYVKEYLDEAYNFYLKDKNYFQLNDRSYLKKLFLDLLVSVPSYDFNDIYSYVNRKKEELKDTTVSEKNFIIGKYDDLYINCSIFKNNSNLEGPYQMKITFLDESNNEYFDLPNITFAVANKQAHVFCVQNKNRNDNHSKLAKKLDRYFRKVNKGVDGESYIANISPNALISLTIFNAYLKTLNVKEVIAPVYMPIRYEGKKVTLYNKYKKDNVMKNENIEILDRIQFNITNKFTYLFFRYQYHFDKCICEYDDNRQEIHLSLNNSTYLDDNIIYQLDKSIAEFNKNNFKR